MKKLFWAILIGAVIVSAAQGMRRNRTVLSGFRHQTWQHHPGCFDLTTLCFGCLVQETQHGAKSLWQCLRKCCTDVPRRNSEDDLYNASVLRDYRSENKDQ